MTPPDDHRVPPPPPPGAGADPSGALPRGWADRGAASGTDRGTDRGAASGADRGELPKAPNQYYVPADSSAPTVAPPGPPDIDPARGPAPVKIEPSRRKRSCPRARRVIAIAVLVLFALVLIFVFYGLWQYQRLERVEVGSVLSPGAGSGTNYLIVGSDSRDGFDPNDPNAGAVLGDGTADDPTQRSDTMLILRVAGDEASMMSIPRDLWVTRADGSQGRINAAYRAGPASLIQTIQGLGVPVHHYVEVDFVTFAGLVDAVGGVTIEIPHPARDDHSGLNLPEAGSVRLDGTQALAYVRSRNYTELIDGSWRTDPTADLGRVVRQQQFLRAVMGEVGSTRNPIELLKVSGALAGGLRVDDNMGLFDSLRLAQRMRGLDPVSVELPVYGFRASGGAAVLGLTQPQADEVLARFR